MQMDDQPAFPNLSKHERTAAALVDMESDDRDASIGLNMHVTRLDGKIWRLGTSLSKSLKDVLENCGELGLSRRSICGLR